MIDQIPKLRPCILRHCSKTNLLENSKIKTIPFKTLLQNNFEIERNIRKKNIAPKTNLKHCSKNKSKTLLPNNDYGFELEPYNLSMRRYNNKEPYNLSMRRYNNKEPYNLSMRRYNNKSSMETQSHQDLNWVGYRIQSPMS